MKLLEILHQYEHYIDVLLEASDYNMMFPDQFVEKVSSVLPKYNRTFFNASIAKAKKTLKREDRIVWYLRLLRLEIVFQYYHKTPKTEETKAILDTELKKYNKKSRQNLTWDKLKAFFPINPILTALEHYLSLKINDINRYVFKYQSPAEISQEFMELEEEYNDSMGDEDRLIPENDEIVFLDCGGGFKWFNLERASCSAEAKAMGHCGNSPSGYDSNQTILSLRQFVKKGDQGYWKPIATFIYHINEKSLGEMKGKNNTKPVKRYHPQILKLLYDDRIQAIHGGGYLPEENFSVNDLDEAVRDKLLEAKPRLMSFMDRIDKDGITEEILKELENAGATIDYKNKEYPYVLETFDNLGEMVDDIGNDTAQWIMNVLEGNVHVDFDEGLDDKQIFDDNLSHQQEEIIREYIRTNHQELYDEAEEANGGDDPDWYELSEQISGDDWFANWLEEFKRLPSDAQRAGTENEMSKALTSSLESLEHEFDIGVFQHGDNVWDSKYTANLRKYELKEFSGFGYDITSAEDFIEALGEHMAEENMELKVAAPYYGFDIDSFNQEAKQLLEQLEEKNK